MNNGLASLHKVLKDEMRRRIVLLLNEKGSLSYTDLMKALEIDNTGRVNYHLKVLDDLVMKKEDGQYALTEKGKLASRLLLEFPEDNGQLYKQWIMANLKAKETNYLLGGIIFWTLALFSLAILVALNSVNINSIIFPWLFFVNGFLLFILHFKRSKKSDKSRIGVHTA
jgi:DNA-binding transcriptional ArsR family regulator